MKQRSPLLQRGILALLSAEIISSLGSQMTFLALPWFVLTTTGSTTRMGIVLAAELLPIATLGIPSGGIVTRLGARRTMLVADLCRVPLMISIPLLYSGRRAHLRIAARARVHARHLHRPVLLRATSRAPRARRRGSDRPYAGERGRRGGLSPDDPARAHHRRPPDRVDRRDERALRRRRLVRDLVPASCSRWFRGAHRYRSRKATRASSPAFASSSATRCFAR